MKQERMKEQKKRSASTTQIRFLASSAIILRSICDSHHNKREGIRIQPFKDFDNIFFGNGDTPRCRGIFSLPSMEKDGAAMTLYDRIRRVFNHDTVFILVVFSSHFF